MTKQVDIYTDGACKGNPGEGGWGAVLIYRDVKKCISGYSPYTTNNKMEITAVIEALQMLKEKCDVRIYSDSALVVNAFLENWITTWKYNNWKNSRGADVKNSELWDQLFSLVCKHDCSFIKVKGHSGNVYNELADLLANKAIRNKRSLDIT